MKTFYTERRLGSIWFHDGNRQF